MILNNIAILAADTSRTIYYLKELISNSMLPAYAILLLNDNDAPLPGQNNNNKTELINLIEKNNIPYDIAPSVDINSDEILSLLSQRKEEVFIFSGFGGVILGENILNSNKKFLHVHGGYLPDYKGSTTNYYSLINENLVGASSIFLSKKIDSGPVLYRKKFAAPHDRTQIDHVYDSKVRSEVLIETLKNYIKHEKWHFESENNNSGEVYYIIHPMLKHLAIFGE